MHATFTWIQHHIFTSAHNIPTFLLAIALTTVVFFAFMAALHQLPPQGKKWLTIICTFVAGLFFALEFFLPAKVEEPGSEPVNFLTPYITPVSEAIIYITVWMIGLGIISLAIVHGRRLLKRQTGWHNSLAFFLAMLGVLVVGFMTAGGDKGPFALTTIYNSLYYGLLVNLDAAMFSLLAFYIASAAYRAFRVRTVEAGLLMGAALIVMLGLVECGVWITHWIPVGSSLSFLRLEKLSQSVLIGVNMPAYRAVIIGVGVGALAMAMRLWLSLERGTFFSQEK